MMLVGVVVGIARAGLSSHGMTELRLNSRETVAIEVSLSTFNAFGFPDQLAIVRPSLHVHVNPGGSSWYFACFC